MQLLTPDIKDNFSAKITRINLAFVPAWNPSWKSSAPEDVGTYWNFHPSLQILLLPLAPCGSVGCTQLRTHDFVLHYIWVKTSWVLNLVFCLSVTHSFSKLPSGWAPVCQVSSGRSRHQGGRGGRVFLPWIEHLDFLQVTLTPLGANRI